MLRGFGSIKLGRHDLGAFFDTNTYRLYKLNSVSSMGSGFFWFWYEPCSNPLAPSEGACYYHLEASPDEQSQPRRVSRNPCKPF
jgi:hypothetical protein